MLPELAIIDQLSILDFIRFLVLTGVFLYVSVLDIKTREINSVIWQFLIVFGLLSIGIELYNTTLTIEYSYKVLANILTATLFAYFLKETNLFGLADVKAIIAIGIALPTFPNLGTFPLYIPQFIPPMDTVFPLVIFTVIVNTTLFLPIAILQILYKNYKNGDLNFDKSGLWIYAYKKPIDELETTFGTIIAPWMADPTAEENEPSSIFEAYRLSTSGLPTGFIRDFLTWKRENTENEDIHLSDIDSGQQLKYFLQDEDTNWESQPQISTIDRFKIQFGLQEEPEADIEEDIERFERLLEQDTVWISPGLPFLVPLTAGLITTFIIGDILFTLLFI